MDIDKVSRIPSTKWKYTCVCGKTFKADTIARLRWLVEEHERHKGCNDE